VRPNKPEGSSHLTFSQMISLGAGAEEGCQDLTSGCCRLLAAMVWDLRELHSHFRLRLPAYSAWLSMWQAGLLFFSMCTSSFVESAIACSVTCALLTLAHTSNC